MAKQQLNFQMAENMSVNMKMKDQWKDIKHIVLTEGKRITLFIEALKTVYGTLFSIANNPQGGHS